MRWLFHSHSLWAVVFLTNAVQNASWIQRMPTCLAFSMTDALSHMGWCCSVQACSTIANLSVSSSPPIILLYQHTDCCPWPVMGSAAADIHWDQGVEICTFTIAVAFNSLRWLHTSLYLGSVAFFAIVTHNVSLICKVSHFLPFLWLILHLSGWTIPLHIRWQAYSGVAGLFVSHHVYCLIIYMASQGSLDSSYELLHTAELHPVYHTSFAWKRVNTFNFDELLCECGDCDEYCLISNLLHTLLKCQPNSDTYGTQIIYLYYHSSCLFFPNLFSNHITRCGYPLTFRTSVTQLFSLLMFSPIATVLAGWNRHEVTFSLRYGGWWEVTLPSSYYVLENNSPELKVLTLLWAKLMWYAEWLAGVGGSSWKKSREPWEPV